MEKDSENLPHHIAIIPDGNRRWAKAKGFKPWVGHREGVKRVDEILKAALDLGIPYFSFWAASRDNIEKRDPMEVKFLLKILKEKFLELAQREEVHKNKVKINILGRWRRILPHDIRAAAEKAIKATEEYNRFFLNILLAYNGTEEIIRAIQEIADTARKKKIRVTPGLIKRNLWTSELPPVDLVIRTGGESHLSTGFMMWDIADAQLYFTETLWPDFSKEEFLKAIEEYSKRERRFGR